MCVCFANVILKTKKSSISLLGLFAICSASVCNFFKKEKHIFAPSPLCSMHVSVIFTIYCIFCGKSSAEGSVGIDSEHDSWKCPRITNLAFALKYRFGNPFLHWFPEEVQFAKRNKIFFLTTIFKSLFRTKNNKNQSRGCLKLLYLGFMSKEVCKISYLSS